MYVVSFRRQCVITLEWYMHEVHMYMLHVFVHVCTCLDGVWLIVLCRQVKRCSVVVSPRIYLSSCIQQCRHRLVVAVPRHQVERLVTVLVGDL